MKRYALFLLAVFAIGGIVYAAKTEAMQIQLREAHVRKAPSVRGKIVATLKYAEDVNVVGSDGAWCEVTAKDGTVSGWLTERSLTTDKLERLSGGELASTSASSDEMALATKGFTPEVEEQFKQNNPEANFAMVDKMIEIQIDIDQIDSFLTTGQLLLQNEEGGAK
jgi:uncharacterized protein YgiM (DUF1202 family)